MKQVCNICKEEKLLSEFHKSKSCKLGVRKTCKKCRSESEAEYKKKYREKNSKEISEKSMDYYNKHKCEISERRKLYYKENSERLKEYSSNYRKNNKQKIKEYNFKYRQTDIRKASQINSESKRRAIIKNGCVTTDEIYEILNEKRCYWCGTFFTENFSATIDHYIPLSKGGLHSKDNIVASCMPCNSAKRAKDPEVFAKEIGKII